VILGKRHRASNQANRLGRSLKDPRNRKAE
jgi:hypothetical protein